MNEISPEKVNKQDDQFGKDIVVAQKQVDYEDGKNIISVIITAISVRVNMPRGTVKALMACFVALILVAVFYAAHYREVPFDQTADYQKGIERIKNGIEYGAYFTYDYTMSREVALPSKDVVISGNYSFTVPAGYYVEPPYLDGEWYANAQAFSFYNWAEDWYLVRTYITQADKDSKSLELIVLERIKAAEDVQNISYDYEDFGIGKVLVCKYEILYENEFDAFAVEYSWADDDGTVCSLEVSTEAGDYEETAKAVMNTVHRSNNAFSNDELVERDREAWYAEHYDEDFDPDDYEAMGIDPYEAMRPDDDEVRRQQAKEAWEEYNDPKPDISDGIIKP